MNILGTSILLQIRNIACPTTWRRVLGDHGWVTEFGDVTALYLQSCMTIGTLHVDTFDTCLLYTSPSPRD